jgi:hypothetical protein
VFTNGTTNSQNAPAAVTTYWPCYALFCATNERRTFLYAKENNLFLETERAVQPLKFFDRALVEPTEGDIRIGERGATSIKQLGPSQFRA